MFWGEVITSSGVTVDVPPVLKIVVTNVALPHNAVLPKTADVIVLIDNVPLCGLSTRKPHQQVKLQINPGEAKSLKFEIRNGKGANLTEVHATGLILPLEEDAHDGGSLGDEEDDDDEGDSEEFEEDDDEEDEDEEDEEHA
eukprot:PhF_6_TR13520/c0_g1_i2/m.21606